MPINVFVSVGRPFTPVQEKFVVELESHLQKNGYRPRTVGRTDFTHTKPLLLVDSLMDKCAGALIIAFERTAIEKGVDKRGSKDERHILGECLATPWNQIESGMAYAKRLPILVVKEDRVRGEGLLEKGYDWYVHSTPLNGDFLSSPEFTGTFGSWSAEAKKRAGWFGCRA